MRHIVCLVFMCCGWSLNWSKTLLESTQTPVHLDFLFDYTNRTIAIPEDKIVRLVTWTKSLLASAVTSQAQLESLVGTTVSVVPACPLAPLHYRALQRVLLRSGREQSKQVFLCSKSVRNYLRWWCKDSGFKGNSIVTWTPPKVNVHVWSDASPWGEGAVNSHGDYFQRSWTETESCQHINLLEIRPAKEGIQELVIRQETVHPYIDNTTACTYIRKKGGTRSYSLCKESLCFWQEMVYRDVHILNPFWLSSQDNLEAAFLSCQALVAWDFQLSHQMFRHVLSFSGHTYTGRFCDQQDKPSPKVHDLGKGRVRGRPELPKFPLGSRNLAVSTGPPSPSCAARGGGAADRGNSNLPGMEMGFVVASSLQDVGLAHLVASSLSSMPQLPRFNQVGRIQYGSIGGSPHQGLPVNESDNTVV